MAGNSTASDTTAARYVTALFALAEEQKLLDTVESDLLTVKDALSQSPELVIALTSPRISRQDQARAFDSILATKKAHTLTQNFFRTLAENRRLALTPTIIEHFMARLRAHRAHAIAQATVARPLTKNQQAMILTSLEKATGRAVHLEITEDPNILGGIVIEVGGKQLDHSIAGRLNRLQQKLTARIADYRPAAGDG